MASFNFHDGNAVRKAVALHFHDGNAVRNVKEAWYHDGNAVRKVFTRGTVLGIPTTETSSVTTFPNTAGAGLTLFSDGSAQWNQGEFETVFGQWFDPIGAGAGAAYWTRATLTSGTFSAGTTGAWLQLSSNRSWSVSRSGNGIKECQATIEISSDAGGAVIVASASVHFIAQVTF